MVEIAAIGPLSAFGNLGKLNTSFPDWLDVLLTYMLKRWLGRATFPGSQTRAVSVWRESSTRAWCVRGSAPS